MEEKYCGNCGCIKKFIKLGCCTECGYTGKEMTFKEYREEIRKENFYKKACKKSNLSNLNEIYFSHAYFDKNKISKLKPLQLGRLKKSLEKQYRYDGVVMTVKENLEKTIIQAKQTTNKMCNWNRKYYNGLDEEGQRKYEEKLKKGKLYQICFDEVFVRDIPKIIYDSLIDDFDILYEDELRTEMINFPLYVSQYDNLIKIFNDNSNKKYAVILMLDEVKKYNFFGVLRRNINKIKDGYYDLENRNLINLSRDIEKKLMKQSDMIAS